jgi:lipoprotein-anchoring transpeptidase ErfK/SrfK
MRLPAGSGRGKYGRMRKLLSLVMFASLIGVAACSPGTSSNGPGETADPPKVELSAPKDGAADVSTAAEIAFTLTGTNQATVALADAGGAPVTGAMRADGSSWVPAQQLKYGEKYSATVTATKSDGSKAEAKTTFTTMAQPANLVDIHSFLGDNQMVGVAAPIVIEFGLDVPKEHQAEVQKRLFVTSNPPQEGIWTWASDHEVHYRSKDHWKPDTKIDARIATGGLAWGSKDWVGRHDITLSFTVGPETLFTVDNATKKMTVTRDGQVLRTMPVSLGKPAAPSSSGNLVVISREPTAIFDSGTYGVPADSPGGYRTTVQFAMRLTWGGEYIHAAPWSVRDQGKRNVSHGCVNVATDQAKWVYDNVKVGDPVIVKGTERHVKANDGWTDWDQSWEDYVKGSAIPYKAVTTPTPTSS